MSDQTLPHIDRQLRTQIHSALKRYHKTRDLTEHAARNWPATQARIQAGMSTVEALRAVLREGLERLILSHPLEAQLLNEQYIEGEHPLNIAETYSLSERTFHRSSARGIDEFTTILKELNREASIKPSLTITEKPDFKQLALEALLGNNLTRTKHALGQYPHPQAMALLVAYLSNLDLIPSEREHIITQLHDVYHAAHGDNLKNVTARQNSLYILGTFASLESYSLLNQVWNKEPHPWPMRAALLGSPSTAKFEEYLYRLSGDDRAREVARTFPRVFYGDQSSRAGLYLDDHKPKYAKTLQFYLSNYPRFLDEASLGLVLYVSRDLIITKGDDELRHHPKLMKMLQQALEIEPLHPLAKKEWTKLRSLSKRIKTNN